MPSRHFRAGVVAVITRANGDVLAFERTDRPGAWQLPQGGIERDEEPDVAIWREVTEETGLRPDQLEFVSAGEEWLAYAWPAEVSRGRKGIGQVQRWFHVRLVDETVEPTPDGSEFTAWRWVDPGWLLAHVVEFRRLAYRRGLATLLGPLDG